MIVERDVARGVHRVSDDFVNWYLVTDGDAVTVVDAGLPRSWASLEAALTTIGRRLSDVEALVLTHAHFDHVGFAQRLGSARGLTPFLHPLDAPIARRPLIYPFERPALLYALRPGVARILGQLVAGGALRTPGVEATTPLSDGEVLDVPGRPVAVATPGHTPGHTAFHLPDRGAVIVGDAIVTLDPYTGRRGPRAVAKAATADSVDMWRSMTKLAALPDAQVVLAGHGPAWTGGIADAVERARAAGQA